MRVLVLGGTGLISTGVVSLLCERGSEVVVLSRGHRRSTKVDGVEYVSGDRNDLLGLETMRSGSFDSVIDMIGFAPRQVEMTVRAFAGSIGQYIFCSTVDVYSKNSRPFPLTESAPRNPSTTFAYALGKARCEQVLEAADREGAFAVTLMRPAATYLDTAIAPVGSYQLNIERLLKGLPIVIHGDGSSLWASAHRDDVANAFANAVCNPQAFSRAFNLASTELLTWDEYWISVAQAMGLGEPGLLHIPTDVLGSLVPHLSEWCVENFQFNNIFDVTAAEQALGFRLTKTWAEGCAGLSFHFDQEVDQFLESSVDDLVTAWSGAVARATSSLGGGAS